MKTAHISATIAADRSRPPVRNRTASYAAASALGLCLAACSATGTNTRSATAQGAVPVATSGQSVAPGPVSTAPLPSTPAAAPAPPQVLPFDEAVLKAATGVFSSVPPAAVPPETAPRPVVVDPLVDGVTGYESRATESIESRIGDLVQRSYPLFAVEKFSPDNLHQAPLVLVGTFTPVNGENKTAGTREFYRFCLVLGDLKTNTVIAKSVARAKFDGVDATPSPVFADSPAWTEDPSTQAYVNTCQATKVGDAINQQFLDGLLGASFINQAGKAYVAGRYKDALDLYNSAATTPAGDQLRVYNGLYLTHWKLGERDAAAEAYRKLVDYGFRRNHLDVKFLFQPGSTRFSPDVQISSQYGLWLQQIAQQAAASTSCLEITGNTSASGAAALNERLSYLRADYIRSRLEAEAPQLRDRMIANGVGSRQTLVGTGKDDASDVLDRRVELRLIPNCTSSTTSS